MSNGKKVKKVKKVIMVKDIMKTDDGVYRRIFSADPAPIQEISTKIMSFGVEDGDWILSEAFITLVEEGKEVPMTRLSISNSMAFDDEPTFILYLGTTDRDSDEYKSILKEFLQESMEDILRMNKK